MNEAAETSTPDRMLLRRIAAGLPQYLYRFSDERVLQDGIGRALDQLGVAYEREFIAGPPDRFDFLCEGSVVIEAKCKGDAHSALRQCARYAAYPIVQGIVIATTRLWGAAATPYRKDIELSGKPVVFAQLRRDAF